MLPVAMAETTSEDYWENCPGPACPANMPNRETNANDQVERKESYRQMDQKQLEQIQENYENEIDEIELIKKLNNY